MTGHEGMEEVWSASRLGRGVEAPSLKIHDGEERVSGWMLRGSSGSPVPSVGLTCQSCKVARLRQHAVWHFLYLHVVM